MISVNIIFTAYSMPKTIMYMKQISIIIKSVNLFSPFVICKSCTVISIRHSKAFTFCSISILCDRFYTMRFLCIIPVFYLISINILCTGKHSITVICVKYFFAIYICYRGKPSCGMGKSLLIARW